MQHLSPSVWSKPDLILQLCICFYASQLEPCSTHPTAVTSVWGNGARLKILPGTIRRGSVPIHKSCSKQPEHVCGKSIHRQVLTEYTGMQAKQQKAASQASQRWSTLCLSPMPLTYASLNGALDESLALLQKHALLVNCGAVVDARNALHYDPYGRMLQRPHDHRLVCMPPYHHSTQAPQMTATAPAAEVPRLR